MEHVTSAFLPRSTDPLYSLQLCLWLSAYSTPYLVRRELGGVPSRREDTRPDSSIGALWRICGKEREPTVTDRARATRVSSVATVKLKAGGQARPDLEVTQILDAHSSPRAQETAV